MKKLMIFVALAALAGCFGENHNEKTADTVTKAIMANDMRPVEADFNAIVRPKLLNRAHVGRTLRSAERARNAQDDPRDDGQGRAAGRAYLRRRLRARDVERGYDDRQRREDRLVLRPSAEHERDRDAVTPATATVAYADRVVAAAQRLRGVANRTPVVTSRTLDALTGARVALKCENLQRMGAFKFRGAYNRLAQLGAAERAAGVVAFSSGNHAQGVALAASLLGIRATIVMPHDAPQAKVAATRGYGAEIVVYERGRARTGADAVARRVARERGGTIVPPFDDPAIVAGQGTVALELLEDVPDLDVLVAPLGGGGLLAGCALAVRGSGSTAELWGVEPEAGDDFRRSLLAGRPVEIPVPTTIADGLQTQSPGAITFPIVAAHCAGVVTVGDDDLRAAVRFAFERLKLVVEPSGAAPLAALLAGKIRVAGKRVGVIISGGNVDAGVYARVLTG